MSERPNKRFRDLLRLTEEMRKPGTRCSLVLLAFAASAFAQNTPATPVFEFHSGFWVNLHHFLYEQATAESPAPSNSPEWMAAVAYYRKEITKLDLLTNEAARINNRLSGLEDAAPAANSGLSPDLIAALDAAAPIYRAQWWPDHDRANRAWIAAAEPLIERYGEALKKGLARIYATDWPVAPIRTDVAEYASRAGAYTTLGPTHITISSANSGNQGNAALEVLFHEASHALVAKLRNTLSTEVKAQKQVFRRSDLWHAIIFYTAGELVRRQLDGYTPYAIKGGLYDRVWPGVPEILDADWKPYMDQSIDLTTAARRLAADYGVAQ
jgi:hypothetical protein